MKMRWDFFYFSPLLKNLHILVFYSFFLKVFMLIDVKYQYFFPSVTTNVGQCPGKCSSDSEPSLWHSSPIFIQLYLEFIHNKNIINKNKVNYSIPLQSGEAWDGRVCFVWILHRAEYTPNHLRPRLPTSSYPFLAFAWKFQTPSRCQVNICFFRDVCRSNPVSSLILPETLLFSHLFPEIVVFKSSYDNFAL